VRTHPKISVAASAIADYVGDGGWLGASFPLHIAQCRRLNSQEYRAALRIANRRLGGFLNYISERNFVSWSQEQ
jgi:hypothetical protein